MTTTTNRLTQGLAALPAGDKTLLRLCFAIALLALALGVLAGVATAAVRAGFIQTDLASGYRLMTTHGVNVFFYWLYFVQAGLLLVISAVYASGEGRIAWRAMAWLGLVAMVLGFGVSGYATLVGVPRLYDAPPELAHPGEPGVAAFYVGYLLLAAGLFSIATAGVATALHSRFAARSPRAEGWSAIGFAAVAWAGLLMVSALASLYAFFPAALWALDLGTMPADYATRWHVLFHNMHYLPLMSTVLVWYVLVENVTGVKSIFGARFSKIIFALYLMFVPPTSLYHMFLEPDLAAPVRVIGSLLSLFISVPTVLVFLVLVCSLEVHARNQGAQGLFGWMRKLPWGNPAMAAMGAAVINLALGGVFSFVLIQEKLAPLLSDTFFVPGYFHFLTVGTVSLTFLAALCYVLPGLTGARLWRPTVLARLPWLVTLGVGLFGAAGIAAGYNGVPRRVLSVAYDQGAPAVWGLLMKGIGVGGTLMAIALLVYLYGLLRTLLTRAGAPAPQAALPSVCWEGPVVARHQAWMGPLSVIVLVGAMALFTQVAFVLLRTLPLMAGSGAGH
ncbi:MAG: cbb3-type cytochrome c oxidase subunit I [Rhodoferax sp.]